MSEWDSKTWPQLREALRVAKVALEAIEQILDSEDLTGPPRKSLADEAISKIGTGIPTAASTSSYPGPIRQRPRSKTWPENTAYSTRKTLHCSGGDCSVCGLPRMDTKKSGPPAVSTPPNSSRRLRHSGSDTAGTHQLNKLNDTILGLTETIRPSHDSGLCNGSKFPAVLARSRLATDGNGPAPNQPSCSTSKNNAAEATHSESEIHCSND